MARVFPYGADGQPDRLETEDCPAQPEEHPERDPAFMLFTPVAPVEGSAEGSERREVRFGLQRSLTCRGLLKELAPVWAIVALTSSFAFASAAFIFGVILHGPSEEEPLPDGYDDWASCGPNATSTATALGRSYPLRTARFATSFPKFLVSAMLLSITNWWLVERYSRWFAAHCVAQAGTVFLGLVALLVLPHPPLLLDAALSFFQLVAFCSLTFFATAGKGPSSRCRGAMHYIAMLCLYSFNIVLINGLVIMSKHNLDPAAIALVAAFLVKVVDFAGRWVFKIGDAPTWTCTLNLFCFQCGVFLSIRRFVLRYSDTRDILIASGVGALIEFLCHVGSAIFVVYKYNRYIRKGSRQMAVRHLNMFLTSTISDIVAEHVALHGSLGFALFVDQRVFTIPVSEDPAQTLLSWAIQLAFELVSDIASIGVISFSLPVTLTRSIGPAEHSWSVGLNILLGILWIPFTALHGYIAQDNFVCEAI